MNYKYFINFLLLILLLLVLSVFSIDESLHIIACDVGQGDSILIQRKTTQVLIDGGPDKSVLDCLGRHMPFWDRQIEFIILTHPQEDHYGGLIDVFSAYEVLNFGEYNTTSSNQSYIVLKNMVGGQGVASTMLTTGTSIRLGLIYLDILHPGYLEKNSNVNDDGVVSLLRYGDFEALFTADVENEVSDELSKLSKIKDIDYIKVNHHGSKNGMSQKLLNMANPKAAVISVGFKNRYNHPNAEIIKILQENNVKIYRTDEIGDVEIITNGVGFWTKK